MNCVENIGFPLPVITQKAIHTRTKLQAEIADIFKVKKGKSGKLHVLQK